MAAFLSALEISTNQDDGVNHVTPLSFIFFFSSVFTTGWLVAMAFGIS